MITHDQVMTEMEFLKQQIEVWGRMANEQIERFQQRIEELRQLDSEVWNDHPNVNCCASNWHPDSSPCPDCPKSH